jgi:hypothetical protein
MKTEVTSKPEPPAAEQPAPKPEPKAEQKPGPKEIGGPPGPEPTRYGDWQFNGRVTDF